MNEAVRIDGYQAKLVEMEIRKTRAERAEGCRIEGLAGMDERTKVICRSRNRFMGKRLAEIDEAVFGRRGLMNRILRGVESVWAMIWALTFGKMWIEIGERLGFWERVDE